MSVILDAEELPLFETHLSPKMPHEISPESQE